ncbi:MAG: tRNA pseudouridine(38-40) synthase TruA, partial [Lachnospiraceae bacterium]|nr:tRNA pseudouridine(38-40) synthase TruA [Lachnospiraceae bacterium]
MRRNILIKIQYDGTKYSGWQRQGNTDNTIERKISSVISKMEKSDVLVELHASGRTDAGVHALGQVANFTTKSDLSEEEMLDYINQYLPEDIRILELYQVDDRFHSRLKAVGKTYVYSID